MNASQTLGQSAFIHHFAASHVLTCSEMITKWPEANEKVKADSAKDYLMTVDAFFAQAAQRGLLSSDSPQLRGQVIWEGFQSATHRMTASFDPEVIESVESQVEEILSYVTRKAEGSVVIEIPLKQSYDREIDWIEYSWGEHGAHFPN